MIQRIVLCVSMLFAVVISGTALPAWAESLMNLPPEMRLTRGLPDQGETIKNVSLRSIAPARLPEAMLQIAKAKLLTCSIPLDRVSDLHAYVWDAPWREEHHLGLNYIIDFNLGTLPEQAGCNEDPLCNEEGCTVLGFTQVDETQAEDDIWAQDFEVRAHHVTFPVTSLSDGVQTREIVITSTIESCEQKGGRVVKDNCERHFLWRRYGLSLVNVQAP